MRVPVILTTYNRLRALRRTIESLYKTDVPNGMIVNLHIDDDGSEGPAQELLVQVRRKCPAPYVSWTVDVHGLDEERTGPNRRRRRSLWREFENSPAGPPEFVITIESDMVFHPTWLKSLLEFYNQCQGSMGGPVAMGGVPFATISPYRSKTYAAGEVGPMGTVPRYVTRPRTGGVCHLITREWYERGKRQRGWMAWEKAKIVAGVAVWADRSGGWDHMMGEQAQRENLLFACLAPSLVDHVSGPEGTTSGSSLAGDRAMDFMGEGRGS